MGTPVRTADNLLSFEVGKDYTIAAGQVTPIRTVVKFNPTETGTSILQTLVQVYVGKAYVDILDSTINVPDYAEVGQILRQTNPTSETEYLISDFTASPTATVKNRILLSSPWVGEVNADSTITAEIIEPAARIAPEGNVAAAGTAEFLGDDVEMDDRYIRRQQLKALGRDLAQLASDDDEQVRRGDQVVGDAAVAAEQPGAERVRTGDRALAADRMGDGHVVCLGESLQCRIATGEVHATTDQEHRPARRPDQMSRLRHQGGVGPRAPCGDR